MSVPLLTAQSMKLEGFFNGPNGRALHVVTIWIKLDATENLRFVTLFPDREVT